ncbi:hypothetical protein CPB85DRAFT_1477353 [Mucidula mucida]|nr:hypothetical protein CPB85DRAFT_1262343 [Mucidula mucida]KAF8899990.1 hypothetical protein CPB85DRAFT_1477353 [Mucidula mucida]
MPNTSLPLELVNLIIQHLSGDTYTLRRCALVSRTWSELGQRALFRDAQLDLCSSTKMAKVLDDLTSMPHLRTLVRAVTVPERCTDNYIPPPGHMSRLASVLSLLPNLTKVAFCEHVGSDDQVATQSYLDLIPNVLGNAPLVELDIIIYSVEAFQHLFGILAGTNIKRVTLAGIVSCRKVNLEATRQRLHIPSLECIRYKVDGDLREEMHHCLMHDFDIPNLKQCEISTDNADHLSRWQGTLRQGFLPVGVVRLELVFYGWNPLVFNSLPAYRPIALAGLYFHHVHLKATSDSVSEIRKHIEWWSSAFRALSADSDARLHFTELTFTFNVSKSFDALKSAYRLLDNSLAHSIFSAVRRIHFEVSEGFIAEALADKMRLALPQLESRGVLSLV